GTRAESVTKILELLLQIVKVIDLPVEHHTDCAVFIEDRLMPTLDVDNAQATHPQRQRPAIKVPFVIRPTMKHGRVHPPHNFRRVHRPGKINYSTNATHGFLRISNCGFRIGKCLQLFCDVLRLGRPGARQVSDLPKKHFTLRVSDPNEWLGGSKTPGFKRACTASQRLAAHPNGLAVVETCRNPVITRTDAARNCEPPQIHCEASRIANNTLQKPQQN